MIDGPSNLPVEDEPTGNDNSLRKLNSLLETPNPPNSPMTPVTKLYERAGHFNLNLPCDYNEYKENYNTIGNILFHHDRISSFCNAINNKKTDNPPAINNKKTDNPPAINNKKTDDPPAINNKKTDDQPSARRKLIF